MPRSALQKVQHKPALSIRHAKQHPHRTGPCGTVLSRTPLRPGFSCRQITFSCLRITNRRARPGPPAMPSPSTCTFAKQTKSGPRGFSCLSVIIQLSLSYQTWLKPQPGGVYSAASSATAASASRRLITSQASAPTTVLASSILPSSTASTSSSTGTRSTFRNSSSSGRAPSNESCVAK